jgi:hypothetical protein
MYSVYEYTTIIIKAAKHITFWQNGLCHARCRNWSYCIDFYVVLLSLNRQCIGQTNNAQLSRAIVCLTEVAIDASGRRHVDNSAQSHICTIYAFRILEVNEQQDCWQNDDLLYTHIAYFILIIKQTDQNVRVLLRKVHNYWITLCTKTWFFNC